MTSINSNLSSPVNPALANRQEKLAAANAQPATETPTAAAAAQTQVSDRVELQREAARIQVNSNDTRGNADYKRSSARQQEQLAAQETRNKRTADSIESGAQINREKTQLSEQLKSQIAPNETEAKAQQIYQPGRTDGQLTAVDLPLPQSEAMQYSLDAQSARREEREASAAAAYEQAQAAEQAAAESAGRAEMRAGNNTPAMRELSSGIEVGSSPAPAVRETAQNTAALQSDNAALADINNEVANIDTQVSLVYNATQDTLRTPDAAAANQQTVDRAVNDLYNSVDRVQVQSSSLRAVNPGELSELNAVLKNLGETPDPAAEGTPLSMRDLQSGGRAAQDSNAELAAQVSAYAAQQLSAVRNTVDTMQGNLSSVIGTTINGALRGMDQIEDNLGNQELAQGAMRSVMSALETSPADVFAAAAGNLEPAAAETLLSE